MPTPRRIDRVRQVLSRRQPDLRVVLENVINAHNASAVLRTCDAAGVLHVHIVTPKGSDFPINRSISTRADKWLEIHRHASVSPCLRSLKKKGLMIVAACLAENAVSYDEYDYTRPSAILFGNESEGISRPALDLADAKVKIPMLGMVQSLNVSVSVGVILYEAWKQREAKGFYERTRLAPADFKKLTRKWLTPKE